MKVSDIMTGKTISIDKDETVATAARLLKRHNIGALPVTDSSKRLRGMITDRDIVLRCIAADTDPRSTPVSEIMSRGIITLSPADNAESAALAMSNDQIRRLPVVEDGRLVGMVSLCDLATGKSTVAEAARALSKISSSIRRT